MVQIKLESTTQKILDFKQERLECTAILTFNYLYCQIHNDLSCPTMFVSMFSHFWDPYGLLSAQHSYIFRECYTFLYLNGGYCVV